VQTKIPNLFSYFLAKTKIQTNSKNNFIYNTYINNNTILGTLYREEIYTIYTIIILGGVLLKVTKINTELQESQEIYQPLSKIRERLGVAERSDGLFFHKNFFNLFFRRPSPKLSSQLRSKGVRCSQRLLKQNKEEKSSPSNTPNGILKYLSPVENKRKNSWKFLERCKNIPNLFY